MTIDLPEHIVKMIRDYLDTDWSKDLSCLGALNAVSFIGEQVVVVCAAKIKCGER